MCSITETHFDCDEKHSRDMRTFQLAPAYPRPEDLTFIESIIWNLPPPWYEAFADGVKLPKSVTTSMKLSISVGLQSRLGRVITFHRETERNPSAGYSTSNIYLRHRTYNNDRKIGRPRLEFYVVRLPENLAKPFSNEEESWRTDTCLRKEESEEILTKLEPRWRSSSQAALTLLTHCVKHTSPSEPLQRFVSSDIYDKNVWRVILQFTLPSSQVHKELLQIDQEPLTSHDEILHSCVTTDGRFFAQCLRKLEHVVITVNGNFAISFRYPSFIPWKFKFSISSTYIAMVFDAITFIVISHTGDYVAHFDLCENLQQSVCIFTLHPTLPLLILCAASTAFILDFQGNVLGFFATTKACHFPTAVLFDSANELVILLDGDNTIAIPLDGSSSFRLKIIHATEAPNLSNPLHSVTSAKVRTSYHWST